VASGFLYGVNLVVSKPTSYAGGIVKLCLQKDNGRSPIIMVNRPKPTKENLPLPWREGIKGRGNNN